jgi:hypothetical protein
MRLVIKNSIQLCLCTLVFSSIVLRHSYYNRIISIVSPFWGTPCTMYIKPGFHMVITVVKIESRSFSTAEIQQFNTDNRQSDNK